MSVETATESKARIVDRIQRVQEQLDLLEMAAEHPSDYEGLILIAAEIEKDMAGVVTYLVNTYALHQSVQYLQQDRIEAIRVVTRLMTLCRR
ncbi:MAG: hypothetical protein K8J31_08390 [Anaerolineae bacterium]|nr:hypothetical protein [Anaerolineae bacterium]